MIRRNWTPFVLSRSSRKTLKTGHLCWPRLQRLQLIQAPWDDQKSLKTWTLFFGFGRIVLRAPGIAFLFWKNVMKINTCMINIKIHLTKLQSQSTLRWWCFSRVFPKNDLQSQPGKLWWGDRTYRFRHRGRAVVQYEGNAWKSCMWRLRKHDQICSCNLSTKKTCEDFSPKRILMKESVWWFFKNNS